MAHSTVACWLVAFSLGSHSEAVKKSDYTEHPMAQGDLSMLDMFFQRVGFQSTVEENAHENGHLAIVRNPVGRFSVVPPLPHGCGSLEQVFDTAKLYSKGCVLATNGGYFDIHNAPDFACIGNVVSDGRVVQTNPGGLAKGNVNLGIRNGKWVVGYISPEEVQVGDFEQLVEGLGWLVRNGVSYVDEDWTNNAYTEAGTSGKEYNSHMTGRTAIGITRAGELLIMQMDGHTSNPVWGASMYEMAEKMIEFGAVEAINVDGGGSVNMVYNNVQVGYTSDQATWGSLQDYYDPNCPIGHGKGNSSNFECPRAVSTILCVHESPSYMTFAESQQSSGPQTRGYAIAGGLAALGCLGGLVAGVVLTKRMRRDDSLMLQANEAEEASSSDS